MESRAHRAQQAPRRQKRTRSLSRRHRVERQQIEEVVRDDLQRLGAVEMRIESMHTSLRAYFPMAKRPRWNRKEDTVHASHSSVSDDVISRFPGEVLCENAGKI